MGWSGGTFSRVHNFSADASAGIQAQASRFDAEFDEYKAGLENCVTRDGQNAASGNLPMGGNKHTGVGAATSAQEYLRADQNTQQTGIWLVGHSPSGGVFSASADVFPAALQDGMRIHAKSSSNNFIVSASTGTIIINGLTAPLFTGGNQVVASQSAVFEAYYDNSQWNLINPRTRISFQSLLTGSDGSTQSDSSAFFEGVINNGVVTLTMNSTTTVSASTSINSIYINDFPTSLLRDTNGSLGFEHIQNVGFVYIGTSSTVEMGFGRLNGTGAGSGTIEFHLITKGNMNSSGKIVLNPFTFTYDRETNLAD